MNVREKELELVESSLESVRKDKTKHDKVSVTFFLASIILYTTSDLNSSVKLALFGIELKSLYAVFILYLLSLVSLYSALAGTIRETLLFDKYRGLLKEVYGRVPESLELITCSDTKLIDKVLVGRVWGKVNTLFQIAIFIPFLIAYYKMAHELISIDEHNKLTLVISFFIFVYGFYAVILLCRTVYIQWVTDNDYKAEDTPT
ncbi:hypothetical protein AB6D84_05125 [Vibrio lentus]